MSFEEENGGFYDERHIEEQANAHAQKSTPMGAPKRKSRVGGWILGILIAVIVVAAGIGIWRTARHYRVQVQRDGDGVSLKLARVQPQKPVEQPQKPQPVQSIPKTEPEPAEDRADAALTLQPPRQGTATRPSSEADALSLQEIYEKMIPSVVSIVTGSSSGTGIIMSEDGYIITNCHVIEGAREVRVMTQDEQVYDASPVGADETSDLAVLKISAKKPLTAAEFGNSDALRVGDSVAAIGDPLGVDLRGTMTNGIVSAINRDMMLNNREMTLIQTNAALNEGNSGGPLINCYGQVIGINVMKLSGGYFSTGVEGLGFAIPISTAKPILDELIEKGYVTGRPAIGINGEALPITVRAYYRLPEGVYVTYVSPDSDAFGKGIRESDIITAINGTPVRSMEEINAVKYEFSAGDTVTLTVYRAGQFTDVSVVLMDEALQ